MTGVSIVDHVAQPTAGVRQRVLMSELSAFFARAFGATLAVVTAQGAQVAGPPFGKYYGTPTDVVDVEAGFPVTAPITAEGDVVPGTLPGGRVAEAMHVGAYADLDATYAQIRRHAADAGVELGPIMWESYLSDPSVDATAQLTRVSWPLA